MDISNNMKIKLDFNSSVYQQISQQLSVIDTFKGNWKAIEGQQSKYLKELRKIATLKVAVLRPELKVQPLPMKKWKSL